MSVESDPKNHSRSTSEAPTRPARDPEMCGVAEAHALQERESQPTRARTAAEDDVGDAEQETQADCAPRCGGSTISAGGNARDCGRKTMSTSNLTQRRGTESKLALGMGGISRPHEGARSSSVYDFGDLARVEGQHQSTGLVHEFGVFGGVLSAPD